MAVTLFQSLVERLQLPPKSLHLPNELVHRFGIVNKKFLPQGPATDLRQERNMNFMVYFKVIFRYHGSALKNKIFCIFSNLLFLKLKTFPTSSVHPAFRYSIGLLIWAPPLLFSHQCRQLLTKGV